MFRQKVKKSEIKVMEESCFNIKFIAACNALK